MTQHTTNSKGKWLRLSSVVTVAAVYLLILVGGIVRSTGSGMGCPDWPKCFGSWVPPTDVSQLPADYKEVYSQQRHEKNLRFANYLEGLGFQELAGQIRNDKSLLVEADFNSAKTWTEYINRLIGVLIGLLVFATVVTSLTYFRTDKVIVVTAFLAFVLVGFQGWIGSIVVSTNLTPWMVTVHMLLALLIVGILIYVAFRSYRGRLEVPSFKQRKLTQWLLLAGQAVLLFQVVLGTQVREEVDRVAQAFGYANRADWIGELGTVFLTHRSYSWVVLALHVLLVFVLFRNGGSQILRRWTKLLISIIVLEVVLGAVLGYFAIPAFIQPLHLLFGTLIFGIQYVLWLLLRHSGKAAVS